MVTPYILSITVEVPPPTMCIISHTLSRRNQITVRFAGHSRIMGPQYESCFVLPFWHL